MKLKKSGPTRIEPDRVGFFLRGESRQRDLRPSPDSRPGQRLCPLGVYLLDRHNIDQHEQAGKTGP